MMPLPAGTIIDGRVAIEELLGRGGMGTVYRAHQIGLDREVAIKFLGTGELLEPEWYQRFEREAQLMGQMHHRNIPAFYGYGTFQDSPYMIVELIKGQDLETRLAQEDRLPELNEVIAIARQVCEALAYAHAHGIIHRDLKLSNILVTADGTIRLIDFGLAKIITPGQAQNITEAGTAVGTILYMSPEQCLGKPPTAETDIYSLGCVLFHLLTGQPPFPGEQAVVVMQKQVAEEVPLLSVYRPDLPAVDSLQNIISCCMAKDPRDRYPSAGELLDDLDRLEEGSGSGSHDRSQRSFSTEILTPQAAKQKARLLPAIGWSTIAVSAVLLLMFAFNTIRYNGSLKDPRAAKYWYEAAQDASRAKDVKAFLSALHNYSAAKSDDDWNKESDCYRDLMDNLLLAERYGPDVDLALKSWQEMEAKHRPNSITYAASLIKAINLETARRETVDYSIVERAARIADTSTDGDDGWRCYTLSGIGSAEFAIGHFDEAAPHLAQSVALLKKLGRNDTTIGTIVLYRFGVADYRAGNRESGIRTLERVFPSLSGRGMWNMAAQCMAPITEDAVTHGKIEDTLHDVAQAQECIREMKPGNERTRLQEIFDCYKADAYVRSHQPDKALDLVLPFMPMVEDVLEKNKTGINVPEWATLLVYSKDLAAAAYKEKQDYKKAEKAARESCALIKVYGLADTNHHHEIMLKTLVDYLRRNRTKV